MKEVDNDDRWYIGRDGLHIVEKLTWEEWIRVGYHVRQRTESAAWALADWLVYGISTFKPKMDQYREIAALTGYSLAYLNGCYHVGIDFPVGRRWIEVAFATHREVRRVADAQDRQDILSLAKKHRMSVLDVRRHIDKTYANNPSGLRLTKKNFYRAEHVRYTHVLCPRCGHEFPSRPNRCEPEGDGGSMRLKRFIEMLRQMSVHFTVSQVTQCVFCWENGTHTGFMLFTENGEYWYLTTIHDPLGQAFELFKYPPPIPAFSDLVNTGVFPVETVRVEMKPKDINHYIIETGGAPSAFLVERDE